MRQFDTLVRLYRYAQKRGDIVAAMLIRQRVSAMLYDRSNMVKVH
jgi:hypothetical protein